MKRVLLIFSLTLSLTFLIVPSANADTVTFPCGGNETYSVLMPQGVLLDGKKCSGSLVIDQSVTVIGARAFNGTYSLNSVIIPGTVTTIDEAAFQSSSLSSVVIPNSVISIKRYAFSSTKLTSVNLPTSISTITDQSFAYTLITSIVIPDSVRTIELGAFTDTPLSSITFSKNISEITAKSIAQKGDMFVVPTLAVNEQIRSHGLRIGLSAESLQKITDVESNVGASIGACLAAGVSLGFGSDVIGTEFDHLQSREFALRGQFQSSLDVLRSATAINAKILRQENMLGVVKVGAKADLILVRSNPLKNLRILENASESLLLIMLNGKLVKNIMNLQ